MLITSEIRVLILSFKKLKKILKIQENWKAFQCFWLFCKISCQSEESLPLTQLFPYNYCYQNAFSNNYCYHCTTWIPTTSKINTFLLRAFILFKLFWYYFESPVQRCDFVLGNHTIRTYTGKLFCTNIDPFDFRSVFLKVLVEFLEHIFHVSLIFMAQIFTRSPRNIRYIRFSNTTCFLQFLGHFQLFLEAGARLIQLNFWVKLLSKTSHIFGIQMN